jgi:transposase-like protein
MIENWVKNGKTSDGRQRYYNTLTKKTKLSEYKIYSPELKALAICLRLKGMTFRGIADVLLCTHPTVMKWFDEFTELTDADFISSDKTRVHEHVEIDELFSFVKKKLKKSISG